MRRLALLALLLAGIVVLVWGILAPPADASTRPRATQAGEVTRELVADTDSMKTRVRVTTRRGVIACVELLAPRGRERTIRIARAGTSPRSDLHFRWARSSHWSGCFLAGVARRDLVVDVTENLPGPIDPHDRLVFDL